MPDRLLRPAARLGSLTVVTTSLPVLTLRLYGNGSPTRQPSPPLCGRRSPISPSNPASQPAQTVLPLTDGAST